MGLSVCVWREWFVRLCGEIRLSVFLCKCADMGCVCRERCVCICVCV